MKNTTKKDHYSTANNSKVGDKILLLNIPYYKEDMRMYYEEVIIQDIEISKTGKRVKITFDNGYTISNIGLNTYFTIASDKFISEMATERGWRN